MSLWWNIYFCLYISTKPKSPCLISYNCILLLFSYPVVSDSGTPWLQQSRLPCPALSPGVFSNPCPSSCWCHPTTSHSDAPFSSCPQSFRASGSFPMSWLLPSGGQSIETSASVLPMNIQDWFPLGLTDLIPLLSKGLSRVFFSTKLWKHWFPDGKLFYSHKILGCKPEILKKTWLFFFLNEWILYLK